MAAADAPFAVRLSDTKAPSTSAADSLAAAAAVPADSAVAPSAAAAEVATQSSAAAPAATVLSPFLQQHQQHTQAVYAHLVQLEGGNQRLTAQQGGCL